MCVGVVKQTKQSVKPNFLINSDEISEQLQKLTANLSFPTGGSANGIPLKL